MRTRWHSVRLFAVLAGAAAAASCTLPLPLGRLGAVITSVRDAQAGTVGIRGTIVDITGGTVFFQDERAGTVFAAAVPRRDSRTLAPGQRIQVRGRFAEGRILPRSVRLLSAERWPPPDGGPRSRPARGPGRIEHLVFVLQENHSFDNYFGTFPGADGLPGGTSGAGGAPFHLDTRQPRNLPHTWKAARAAMDGGKMDRFVSAEGSRETMGWYDERDIPLYWEYARRFALADRFFSSFPGPSLPNHLFAVAAQSGGIRGNRVAPGERLRFPTLPERLSEAGVSWRYYDGSPGPRGFLPLDPLRRFVSFQEDPRLRSGIRPTAELFQDLRDGSLPSVSWVIPNVEESEHPPMDIQVGMWYVAAVMDAIMKSRYWSTSLVILAWDEYGGFFDHVAPPAAGGERLGLRVPAILVSPWVRPGSVIHGTFDFSSVLRLAEDLFGVPPLTPRDARAGDLRAALDLDQRPLPPVLAADGEDPVADGPAAATGGS